jgi:hypothetical protein
MILGLRLTNAPPQATARRGGRGARREKESEGETEIRGTISQPSRDPTVALHLSPPTMPGSLAPNTTTRASRSRFSSPQIGLNGATDPSAKSGRSSSPWAEPPINGRPSYLDAGLQRHGVVENMAALGTLPKKQPPLPDHSHSRRIILKRPSITHNTPTPAPADEPSGVCLPTAAASGHSQDEDGAAMQSVVDGEKGTDDDYEPMHQASRLGRAQAVRRSLGRDSPRRQASTDSSAASNKELVDAVVAGAVDEALAHFRYPTAWALRTLYDENSADPQFVAMMDDVFRQRADVHTLGQFTRLMHDKKKEGKKDNKGCYYFIPPTTNNHFPPHKPKVAPYADLLRPATTPSPVAESDNHLSKKARSAKSHRSLLDKMAPSPVNSGTPTRRRRRSDSEESSSSLSSALSLSPPKDLPPPATTSQPVGTRRRSAVAQGRRREDSPTPLPSSPAAKDADETASASGPPRRARGIKDPSPQLTSLRFPSKVGVLDENDAGIRRRRDARAITSGAAGPVRESFVRAQELDGDRESAHAGLALAAAATSPIRPTRAATLRSTRANRKRSHDDMEDDASPTNALFPPLPALSGPLASGQLHSRADTPAPRPVKKPRTGLRVKNSYV